MKLSISSPGSPVLPVEPAPHPVRAWLPYLKIFASTFVTIFLAELGDKTQLTTLLMSAESHSPWIVFMGAGSALIATSFLGVLLGQWIATRVAPRTLEIASGSVLLLVSLLLAWDILHG